MPKQRVVGKCRLCETDAIELQMSHIVPKMFYEQIKKNSKTGGLREVSNPNKREQDGLKLPFLCSNCEELFSKYETYFANNILVKMIEDPENYSFSTSDDNIRYFLLSVAWRVLRMLVETDVQMMENFTDNEKLKLYDVLDKWRLILKNQNIEDISNCEMFIIPTIKLKLFEKHPSMIYNNVSIDFKTFDQEDEFNHAFIYIKVPYYIFVITVWGSTTNLKQNKVGKIIKPRVSQLPIWLEQIIIKHINVDFANAVENMSPKQIDSINHRVNVKNQIK